MNKRLMAGVASLALAGSAAFAAATPAYAATMTVSGYVTCMDQLNVTGVWIAASSGSGWATRTGSGYNQRFSRAGVSGSWTVHVGCGGTPSQWLYTPNGNATVTSAYQSWSCYTPDMGRNLNFCQRT